MTIENKKFILREFHKLCADGVCNVDFLTESEKLEMKNDEFIELVF